MLLGSAAALEVIDGSDDPGQWLADPGWLVGADGSVAAAPAAPVEQALPKTASSSPSLALLGMALVAAGLFVGRKTR